MIGDLSDLGWALGLFVVSHFVMSAGPVRSRLVSALGAGPFRGVYSAVSIGLLVWSIAAYGAAPDMIVWHPHMALRHIPLTVMAVAFILLVGGYTVPNPSAVVVFGTATETPGVLKITRHPVLWAVGVWGILHLFANGDAATMMLAASMAVLAIGGAWHIERRRAADPDWQDLKAVSSFIPFAGIITGRVRVTPGQVGWWRIGLGLVAYAGFLWGHQDLFGASPMPLLID